MGFLATPLNAFLPAHKILSWVQNEGNSIDNWSLARRHLYLEEVNKKPFL